VANVLVNLPLATTAAANVIKERQDTLEVRLASASDAALKWVAGLYYLDSSDETPPFAASRIALPATATTFPWYSGNKTSSAAAFGQLTFPITTWLRVTGGARYTQDKKTAYDLPTATTTRAFDGSWNSSTFKAGVEADLSASSMLYGNVSTGFKAGGIVKDGGSTGFATYLPENLTAFTLGSKNRFRQNSVQLNAEAYYYDYKDFQAAYGYRCQNAIACPSISTFSNTIVNAGKATLYGGELEAVARITPDDRVDLNLAYSHTLFDSLVIRPGTANNIPAGCATTLTCTVLADQVLTNQHMANAPLWTVSLAYQHVWTMPGGGDLTMRADSRFSTSYWTLYRRPPQTPAESFQDAFVKSNAYLSYSPENGKWGLRLWVKNISNKAVVTSAVGPALTMQAPRTFGTTFSAKF
jgi:iron complex outermembrane receptor protein